MTRLNARPLFIVWALGIAAGCGEDGTDQRPDAAVPPRDVGVAPDGGLALDAGAPEDGGTGDGGPGDVGPADSGPADSGPADGGPADGGPADGGPADGGPGPGRPCDRPFPTQVLGTPLDDAVNTLTLDHEGRIVVGGYRGGLAHQATLSPIGSATGFVSWLEPDGREAASATLETPDADVVEDLAVLEGGRVLALGRTLGTLPGQARGGQYDLVFAVFEPGRASPIDAIQLGDRYPEHPRRLALGPDGPLAVGYTDVYVPTNYVEAMEEPLVQRARWEEGRLRPGEAYRGATGATDFYQDARFAGDGTDDLLVAYQMTAGSRRGAWLLRVTPEGREVWGTRISRSGYDSAMVLLPAADGLMRVVGSTFEILGESAYGQQDVYVLTARISDGAIVGAAQYGTSETDWVWDAALGPDGDIHLVGETLGSFDGASPAPGFFRAFAMRLDPAGAPRGVFIAGASESVARAVAVDTCGRALVGGETWGPLEEGGPSWGGADGFILEALYEPPPSRR